MSEKLFLRTDADINIGSGHAMRCIALAQAWRRQGGDPVFLSAILPKGIRERLDAEEFDLVTIDAAPGSNEDARETSGHSGSAWTVVDGRRFSHGYISSIQGNGGRILWWDDVGSTEPIEADVVLNQNIHANVDLYPAAKGTLLLGTTYVCLREEFLNAPRSTGSGLLITFGGWPPSEALEMVAEALASLDVDLPVTVVGDPVDGAATKQVGGSPITYAGQTSEMSSLMRGSLLAVSAAGTTTWELCYFGIPQVLFVLSDDQEPVAGGLEAAGCAIDMGAPTSDKAGELANTLRRLLTDEATLSTMSRRCSGTVDGRGADRVVTALKGSP